MKELLEWCATNITTIAAAISIIVAMFAFIRNLKIDLKKDIENVEGRLTNQINRIDNDLKSTNTRIDTMNARFDTMNARFDTFLYEWKAESLKFYKEWKEETKDFHARLILIEEKNKPK